MFQSQAGCIGLSDGDTSNKPPDGNERFNPRRDVSASQTANALSKPGQKFSFNPRRDVSASQTVITEGIAAAATASFNPRRDVSASQTLQCRALHRAGLLSFNPRRDVSASQTVDSRVLCLAHCAVSIPGGMYRPLRLACKIAGGNNHRPVSIPGGMYRPLRPSLPVAPPLQGIGFNPRRDVSASQTS